MVRESAGRDRGKETAVKRKVNGLRHGFCTFHYAVHSNENLTATGREHAGNDSRALQRPGDEAGRQGVVRCEASNFAGKVVNLPVTSETAA